MEKVIVSAMTLPVNPSGVRCCISESASTENIVHTSCPAQKAAVSAR